jgi:hypothetical protein
MSKNLTELFQLSVLNTGDLLYFVRPSSGSNGDFAVNFSNLSSSLAITGGASIANAVLLTGNQTVSGHKTFAGTGTFNQGIELQYIYEPFSHLQKVDVGNQILSIDAGFGWKLSDTYIATEPWSSSALLSKIVPAVPPIDPSPATLDIDDSNFGSITDGDYITIVCNTTYTFEFDNDSSVAGGSTPVDMSDIYNNLTSAINSLSGSLGVTAVFNGSDTITLTSSSTGSSTSISITGSIGSGSFSISQSASGSDGDSGTPESGTRFAILKNAPFGRKLKMTHIAVSVRDDTAWLSTGIEVGYWNGMTFFPICQIAQSALTPGVHFFPVEMACPDESGVGFFFSGDTSPIAIRMGYNGTPADEFTGSDAVVYAAGFATYST